MRNSFIRSQTKTGIGILALSWCLITMFYFDIIYNSLRHATTAKTLTPTHTERIVYEYNGTEDFLINTPGCYIPSYHKTLVYPRAHYLNDNCGERAIFVEKLSHEQIQLLIDKKMEKYAKGKITCCYQFGKASNKNGTKESALEYTPCEIFQNGTRIKLQEEIITVTCKDSSKKIKYEDAYTIVKKRSILKHSNSKRWNVILLGMDTMSRARMFSTMPKTVQYFKSNNWLDYKGYQKVGLNTFPNLMAFLTGKKLSSIYKACTDGMENCNDFLIWSKFHDAGYVTAYGEEFLRLPDTFARYGYKQPPTDHYLRPFFMIGESVKGNVVCTRKKTSGMHILSYASDFVNTYKNDSFFGMFWLNSYSHNTENIPTLFDKPIVDFFETLKKTNALDNTFIIFLSDHGIRFGDMRLPMESYYEERLPMLFMWVPYQFRQLKENMYYSLQVNQNRLISNYDLYLTMASLLKINNSSIELEAEACPNCTSLFEQQSIYRTCADAGVDDKWCSCHNMTVVKNNDIDVVHSLELAIAYVQSMAISVETKPCTTCSAFKLKSLLRNHKYENGFDNNTYFVMAFTLTPGDLRFEATVLKTKDNFKIVPPIDTISPYNSRGSCVISTNKRAYCVCKNVKCNKKPKK